MDFGKALKLFAQNKDGFMKLKEWEKGKHLVVKNKERDINVGNVNFAGTDKMFIPKMYELQSKDWIICNSKGVEVKEDVK